MADEATQEVEQTSAAEATAAESQPVEQAKPAEGEQGQEPQKPAESPAAPTGEPKQEQKPQPPPSRRSAAYRIQELVRENKELKQQKAAPKEETVDEWGNPTAPTEDKPDPKYAKLESEIEALKGLVKPVMTNSQKAADEAEIAEVFTGKPEEKAKYEGKIREMWELPQYKDLAASDLYKIATYDETIANAKAQAVEEYKQAQKEAKDASASGSSNTSNRTGGHVPAMTDAELLANNERVKAGVK
jgi:hypothetical protein